MKALFACKLLLLTAVILSTPYKAAAQSAPSGMTLKQFSSELHKIIRRAELPFGSNWNTAPALASAISADPTLASYPSIRTNSTSILSDVQTLRSLKEQFRTEKPSQLTRPNDSGSSGHFDPRKEAKATSSLWNKHNKSQTENLKKQQEIEATIKRRLETIDRQIETPLGQQFLLPPDSAVASLLRKTPPFEQRVELDQRFEVVSNTDGGFLAYLQKSVPAAPGTKERTFVTDRSRTVFVSGYKKPAAVGEFLRVRVSPSGSVTIQGMPLQEFIVVE